LPRCGQRRGKLRPPIERIGSFAGFDLGELSGNRDGVSLDKSGDCCALRFQAET
jgi:hypothetical protein